MFRVPIRSRLGNVVVGVLGVVYFLAAGATLIFYIASNWGANSLVDLALQGALCVAVVISLFFIAIAADNLGLRRSGRAPQTPPTVPGHRRAAAAGS